MSKKRKAHSTAPVAHAAPSPAPNWERAPQFGRRETLLRALRALNAFHPGPATIVETGTLRDDQPQACHGDGWSTVAWGWYAAQTGGRAVTVDNDPKAIAVARKHTRDYAGSIEYAAVESLRSSSAGRRGSAVPSICSTLTASTIPNGSAASATTSPKPRPRCRC